MRIAYYCQHVLGIGHFHRSLEICMALAEHHEVQLIVGGPPVDSIPEHITIYQLPGLQMDADFKNLTPCDPTFTLEQVKAIRCDLLISFFKEYQPDVFVVELYPFGRKAFRFELDPVLDGIQKGFLPPCKCYVSLRDILVERPNDRDKFEQRAVTTLNAYFDGLLIHSDEKSITLAETFRRVADIAVPTAYTGFVTKHIEDKSRHHIREELQLAEEEKLIVVSIGGGNVGSELIVASLEAFRLLEPSGNYHMQLFTGPYCSQEIFDQLQTNLPGHVSLDRFSNVFPYWLKAADLSISMAGYNTCMNIIQAGVPALVYPFAQNKEQYFRASRFQNNATIEILNSHDLESKQLKGLIEKMCSKPRYPVTINLNGAVGSRQQIEEWHQIEAKL